jgi:hypothetical protein
MQRITCNDEHHISIPTEARGGLVLCAGGSKPAFAEMAALADAAADLPISSPLTERVGAAVAEAEAWQERARRLLAKRNSGQRLSKCLAWVQSSLDRALDQLTMRLEVRAPLSAPFPPISAPCLHSSPCSHQSA